MQPAPEPNPAPPPVPPADGNGASGAGAGSGAPAAGEVPAQADAPPKRRRRRRQRLPAGTSPGMLVADPDALPSSVRVLAYGPKGMVDETSCSLHRLAQLRESFPVLWVAVHGLGDLPLLRRIGEQFELHRLALEDVVSTHQRAKLEDYGSHEFLVMRVADAAVTGEVDHAQETEQLSMFVGQGFVLTFHATARDCFPLVRQRAAESAGLMRQRGSDYLAYALFDAVVDSYFPVLEHASELLQDIEDRVLEHGDAKSIVTDLHRARRWLQTLRRAVWPLRDVSGALQRTDSSHFTADVRIYLRDVHDHVVQQIELLENQRELASGLLELHLTVVNHRLNEVMKVLTIIATIFIPLTFLSGLYGMNFDWMPELRVWWGYPVCLGVMAVTAAIMLRWFRRRGWL